MDSEKPDSKTGITRTVISPMMPRAGVLRDADIKRFTPHRCHPRLADTVHVFMHLGGFSEAGTRLSLLAQCYMSEGITVGNSTSSTSAGPVTGGAGGASGKR